MKLTFKMWRRYASSKFHTFFIFGTLTPFPLYTLIFFFVPTNFISTWSHTCCYKVWILKQLYYFSSHSRSRSQSPSRKKRRYGSSSSSSSSSSSTSRSRSRSRSGSRSRSRSSKSSSSRSRGKRRSRSSSSSHSRSPRRFRSGLMGRSH